MTWDPIEENSENMFRYGFWIINNTTMEADIGNLKKFRVRIGTSIGSGSYYGIIEHVPSATKNKAWKNVLFEGQNFPSKFMKFFFPSHTPKCFARSARCCFCAYVQGHRLKKTQLHSRRTSTGDGLYFLGVSSHLEKVSFEEHVLLRWSKNSQRIQYPTFVAWLARFRIHWSVRFILIASS